MNARDNSLPADPVVADDRIVPNAPRATWLPDFSVVDPAPRRAARYVLQLVQMNRKHYERSLSDRDTLDIAWEVVAPLVDANVPDATSSDSGLDDEDEYGPDHRAARWRQGFLLRPPAGVLERLAREDGDAPTHPCVAMLVRILALGAADARLLDFVEKRHSAPAFCRFLRTTENADTMTNCERMAAMLGLTAREIRYALVARSQLRRVHLIRHPERGFLDLEDFIVAGNGLADILLAAPETEQALTELLIEPAPPPAWALSDFPHLAGAASRVKVTLAEAARRGEAGVNALLFGPPGIGKTEFALAVAAEAGLHAFRIRSADDDGDGLDRSGRLSAYLIAQRILMSRRDVVILFDEVEDVFLDEAPPLQRLFGGQPAGRQKGWMNRTLEENPVPAIWITNDVEVMDPAFLRRFLLPVEFTDLPRLVRRRMVDRHLGESALPQSLLEQLAADDKLAPAQLGAARRLLALHGAEGDAVAGEAVVREGVAAMRRLLHGSGLPAIRRAATEFDVAFLNVGGGIAPARIAEALARRGRGSLCFYGPPGTGKTEFAHVLADALERELVARQTSDLVSPYVGETEANIAKLFRTVDAERSVLFIDEVDSFLRDRRLAQRGWEVSQVNELLQHMERFPGIFIAATNLMEDLDAAALRRFDFKLQFRPLLPEQRLAIFAREALGAVEWAAVIPASIRNRLAALEQLTAGDFANVCRQRDLLGEALKPEEFLRRLVQECRWKTAAAAA